MSEVTQGFIKIGMYWGWVIVLIAIYGICELRSERKK